MKFQNNCTFKIEFLSIRLILLLLFFPDQYLPGQASYKLIQSSNQDSNYLNTSPSVRGRIMQSDKKIPVAFADISSSDKTSFAKSNSVGEFVIQPLNYPVILRIKKFGFSDKVIIVNDPNDSILIPLDPLFIQKNSSGLTNPLQYELILKRAIEKFKVANNPGIPVQDRKLVYCRIVSKIDSTINNLFESYAQMSVSKYSIKENKSEISRYAATKKSVPGLSEIKLDFDIYPFIRLPMFIERFIGRRGYFVYNEQMIAILNIDLKTTKIVYYINIADTSIIHITSNFISDKISQVSGTSLRDYRSSTSINLVRSNSNRDNYIIDYVCQNEKFILRQKNIRDHIISNYKLFTSIPDSSLIRNVVRDQALYETLDESVKQINFSPKYTSSGNHSLFDSEMEDLLSKPYSHEFWNQCSYVAHDNGEQKQIWNWENEKKFYSENYIPAAIEIANADTLMNMMNRNLVNIENVYIETDRNYYFAGDTIWFSAFVLDNLKMDSTSMSKILCVDLINADNTLEKQLKLLIKNGRSKGEFAINKNAENGKYRLRAYTQYMRNFQSEFLFEKDIPVYQSEFNRNILVNPVINKCVGGDSVDLYIRTIFPDEFEYIKKRLNVVVRLNDTLTIIKSFDFNKILNGFMRFFVPSSLDCSSVDIQLTLFGKTIISTKRISLSLNSDITLQFFPESGKLVDGIETMIAYKALDNSGDPTEFSADIVDERQRFITHITSDKTGVGKLTFTPDLIHTYKAIITSGHTKYTFNMPAVEPKGYVLNFDPVSRKFLIKNNGNSSNSVHYLVLSVRGVVYATFEIKLDSGILELEIPFERYPKGIIQITLFDNFFRPQAERLVFNACPEKSMLIHIETEKKEYMKREKVNLTIKCTDVAGNPIQSTLSLAILDNSGNDSIINFPDIESYLYISTELKGKIDYSLINISDTTSEANIKRDLVLMTQGWRNFLWNSIRYAKTLNIIYPMEKGFFVDGTVFINNDRRSYINYNLNYVDFNSGFNGLAKIDENHRFEIDIPLFYGSHVFFIQNINRNNKIENLGIRLDTITYPKINYRNNELTDNHYRAGYLDALNYKFAMFDSIIGKEISFIELPEAIIKARSNPSNPTPDISINLEKKDPTGKKYSSLFQMISEEFGEKAFTALGFGTKGKVFSPILVVNGYPYTAPYCPPCHSQDYDVASSIPVNEVTDVKFYEAGSKYSQWLTPNVDLTVKWKTDALGNALYMLPPDPHIYLPVVSIKTYSDSYRGNPKGAIIFTFQGIYQAREFFQPVYESDNQKLPDNRTTVYWNPEVNTDSTGVARISFYNTDLKGKSLIKVSGVSYSMKEASTSFSYYFSK